MSLAPLLGALLGFSAFGVVPSTSSVTLAWDPSTASNIAGYKVYYGGVSHNYTNFVSVGNATSATISGLSVGVTYFMAATAIDSLGIESDYSNEITYTVPGSFPPLQMTGTPGGQIAINGTGQAGQTFDVLGTKDLVNWTVLGRVTVPSDGSFQFVDPGTSTNAVRFYRIRGT